MSFYVTYHLIDQAFGEDSQSIVCSNANRKAYSYYESTFLRVVPVDEILNELKSKHILSNNQVETMRKECKSLRDKTEKLLDILRDQRSDEDFLDFCKILQNNGVKTVRELGIKLQKKGEEYREENLQQEF